MALLAPPAAPRKVDRFRRLDTAAGSPTTSASPQQAERQSRAPSRKPTPRAVDIKHEGTSLVKDIEESDSYSIITETQFQGTSEANYNSQTPASASTGTVQALSPTSGQSTYNITNMIRFACNNCKVNSYVTFNHCRKDWFLNEVPEHDFLDTLPTSWTMISRIKDVNDCNGCRVDKESELDWSTLTNKEQGILLGLKRHLDREEDESGSDEEVAGHMLNINQELRWRLQVGTAPSEFIESCSPSSRQLWPSPWIGKLLILGIVCGLEVTRNVEPRLLSCRCIFTYFTELDFVPTSIGIWGRCKPSPECLATQSMRRPSDSSSVQVRVRPSLFLPHQSCPDDVY